MVLISSAYAACKSVMTGATVLICSSEDGHDGEEMDANSNGDARRVCRCRDESAGRFCTTAQCMRWLVSPA